MMAGGSNYEELDRSTDFLFQTLQGKYMISNRPIDAIAEWAEFYDYSGITLEDFIAPQHRTTVIHNLNLYKLQPTLIQSTELHILLLPMRV